MTSEETLDVLNALGEPAGERKTRAAVHRSGDLHRALHVWIVREGHYVLFQRRAASKDLEPGKIDVTVGGHLMAGETVADAVREVEEELGLSVDFARLRFLGTLHSERRYPDAIDRELQEVYLLACDQALDEHHPNAREVEVLYELPLEGALALYREGRPLAVAGWDAQGRNNHALLTLDDLIAQARDEVITALEWIETWLKQKGA